MQYHPIIGGNRKITAEKAVHEYLLLYHDSLPTFSHPSKHHMTIGVSVTKPLNYASSSAQHCNR